MRQKPYKEIIKNSSMCDIIENINKKFPELFDLSDLIISDSGKTYAVLNKSSHIIVKYEDCVVYFYQVVEEIINNEVVFHTFIGFDTPITCINFVGENGESIKTKCELIFSINSKLIGNETKVEKTYQNTDTESNIKNDDYYIVFTDSTADDISSFNSTFAYKAAKFGNVWAPVIPIPCMKPTVYKLNELIYKASNGLLNVYLISSRTNEYEINEDNYLVYVKHPTVIEDISKDYIFPYTNVKDIGLLDTSCGIPQNSIGPLSYMITRRWDSEIRLLDFLFYMEMLKTHKVSPPQMHPKSLDNLIKSYDDIFYNQKYMNVISKIKEFINEMGHDMSYFAAFDPYYMKQFMKFKRIHKLM